jgi:hypothetical protein
VPPCERKTKGTDPSLSRTGCREERLPTSMWRNPASSSSKARRVPWPWPASPPPRSQTPLRRTPAPPRRVPPLPWTARWRALPRPPQAFAPLPPPRLSVRGVQAPTSQGGPPPSLSSSSSSPDGEYSEVAGAESPCYSRSRNSSSLCSRRCRRRILRFFLCAARSCSRRCAARALGLEAWAGRTA